MDVEQALLTLNKFQSGSLALRLAGLEQDVVGLQTKDLEQFCRAHGVTGEVLEAAKEVKRVAGQINVIIHAVGILRCLSKILQPGEKIVSVSLGAGNTGRPFDLETTLQIAEFKFIDWKGGPEATRQNGIFRDFFHLAEYETGKRRVLYVNGTEHPMKFLNGGRALSSVLGKEHDILARIRGRYGPAIVKVRDYYALKKDDVFVQDARPFLGDSA